ncbi:hypothetical protein ORJ04_03565 [Rheinheimera baltica]|uniref:Uncharacterized protein n=1 Tax=Rheinheimera baltica TaxID=67576 RepID=A0ABT9HV70_9GAMM|nr:hypothetical protein [Rheinheimera baltica]MDP5135025.1 hypothetical protein [Rheinheimera baltica]
MTRVYQASKNAQGDYECYSVTDTVFEQRTAASGYTNCDDPKTDADTTAQPFYIDPNIADAMPPGWAVQANTLFMQSLHSNAEGGHAEYLKQMRAQFELMRQTLQQQMTQFSHKG